jgi:BirA family biotin operon repressor/biotin-[acetyl-CoA-carboxylase] ligase
MSSAAPSLAPPFRLVTLETIDSTNDEAKRRARQGAGHGTVIQACEQTAGRGRRGRSWHSPAGNLHVSLLLDPGVPLHSAAQLGFVASAALAQGLAGLAPAAHVECKWPNDVWCNGRKIAGMLLEPAEVGGLVVLGVGVDVVAAPHPALYDAIALTETGCAADAAAVLRAFIAAFAPLFEVWRDRGFAAVRRAWLARARGLGAAIEVRLERETLSGTFVGLDEDGALLLELADGQRRRVLAGDVFFPRA